jgi:hypothetical protein
MAAGVISPLCSWEPWSLARSAWGRRADELRVRERCHWFWGVHIVVRVLWFLLFLLAYVIYIALSFFFGKADTVKTKTLSFFYLEAACLLSTAVLYVFVLILTRFSNILIAGYYFLSAQVYIFVAMALGIVRFGRRSSPYRAETIWATACFLVRHIWLIGAVNFIQAMVGVIAYPVVAGIIFFSGDSVTSVTLGIIRITLLILFVGGLGIALPVQLGVALSENLSSATRRRFFVCSAAGILSTGVLLSTLLWTFNASAIKTARSPVSFHLAYSPLELSILVVYFVIIFLLPYVIGVVRSTQQENDLQGRKTELLSKTIDILRIPKSDFYAQALSNLLSEVQTQFISFVRSDKSIAFGLSFEPDSAEDHQLDKGPADDLPPAGQIEAGGHDPAPLPSAAPSATALAPDEESHTRTFVNVLRRVALAQVSKFFDPVNYRLARPEDLRFQYIDWLDMLYGRVTMTAADLQTKHAGSARVSAARSWLDSYEKGDLARPPARPKNNALTALVATTIITSLLGVLVTGFGNWLWTQVAHTLPK